MPIWNSFGIFPPLLINQKIKVMLEPSVNYICLMPSTKLPYPFKEMAANYPVYKIDRDESYYYECKDICNEVGDEIYRRLEVEVPELTIIDTFVTKISNI